MIWFGMVWFLCGLFNVKANLKNSSDTILDQGVHPFLKDVILKMNIAQLHFELAYFEAIIWPFKRYAMGTPLEAVLNFRVCIHVRIHINTLSFCLSHMHIYIYIYINGNRILPRKYVMFKKILRHFQTLSLFSKLILLIFFSVGLLGFVVVAY